MLSFFTYISDAITLQIKELKALRKNDAIVSNNGLLFNGVLISYHYFNIVL